MSSGCKCKDCDCKKVSISLEREFFWVRIKAETYIEKDRCIKVIKKYCKENGYDFATARTMDTSITKDGKVSITIEVRKAEVK